MTVIAAMSLSSLHERKMTVTLVGCPSDGVRMFVPSAKALALGSWRGSGIEVEQAVLQGGDLDDFRS